MSTLLFAVLALCIMCSQHILFAQHAKHRPGPGPRRRGAPDIEKMNPQDVMDLYNGKVVKGNRNALFLLDDGRKRFFPDFYTFITMGYNVTSVLKIDDEILNQIPLGPQVVKIQAPPPFRPEDYMYHTQCEDTDRMVSDLGVVQSMGNYFRYSNVMRRIRAKNHVDIVALGGSITAGGYFEEFKRHLVERSRLNVTVHNHGHGATEITYTIFCVDMSRYEPDLVLIDFSVNDYGHPKLMDALLRKVLAFKSEPIVVLVNLWAHPQCPVTRYLLHAFYYQLPVINMCPAINLCYGRNHLPKHISDKYSKTDGVHPWGRDGVPFIGKVLYSWWKRYETIMDGELSVFETKDENPFVTASSSSGAGVPRSSGHRYYMPQLPLYADKPVGTCTRCDALVDDADSKLRPLETPVGFKVVTRVKVGYGGFHPEDRNSSTKSFKRSWQAETAGARIKFRFYGSSVKVAMWQRRDGMGVIHAHVDDDTKHIAKASGFFKGYTWAMEKNNTGRSEIVPLFEGLPDTHHTITLTVSDEPANPWVKGHTTQIFALLSASDNARCKTMALEP